MAHLIAALKVHRFWIVDSSFEDPLPEGLQRMRSIATDILTRRLNLRYYTFHRAESIARLFSEELLALLRQSGLRRVFIGVESATDIILKAFAKPSRKQDIASALDRLTAAGLAVRCGFIMFTPESTAESLLNNVKFLRERNLLFSTTDLFTRLELYSGTAEVETLRKQGLLRDDFWRNPYAYRFLDERAEWLAEAICPLRRRLSQTADWEILHNADLIATSARLDQRVMEDCRLAVKVRDFCDELTDIKEMVSQNNETFMREAVNLAWGNRKPAAIQQLIEKHIVGFHVPASQTVRMIAIEFLLGIRSVFADFIY